MRSARHRPLTVRLGALALAVALGSAAPVRGAPSAIPDPDAVRRLLTLLGAVGEEYREAFDERGTLARPLEYAEAESFLAEARQRADRLAAALPADLLPRLAALAAAVGARAPVAAVAGEVRALGEAIAAATGVAADIRPPAPPSAARGAALFTAHCSSCHGAGGAGDGPEAARVARRPADFTDVEFMRGETPLDFFHVISLGRRGAAMPGWEDVLSVQERWDLVAYLWSLAADPTTAGTAGRTFAARCAGCHATAADDPALATRSDRDLFAALATVGTAHETLLTPPMSEGERWQAITGLRALSHGAGRADTDVATAAVDETARLLAAAVDAYRRGDPAAADLATDAYLGFEPIETPLRARAPALVRRAEERFMGLRAALARPGAAAEVERMRGELVRDLDLARSALGSTADAPARFVQAATIILREGIEVVLVIGALLAYVVKSGNPGMRRPIYVGTAAGLAASGAAAALVATALRWAPGASDILEGASMLLAAAVLFWVSYWLVSKAEAEQWQRYLRGKVRHALAAGSGFALAAAAFLAVFREGCETILFYQALFASAPSGDLATIAGIAAGTGLLGLVYAAVARFGMRIPLRAFFRTTGALLYAMAIAFAGRGVYELQEAGVLGITPVPGVPHIPVLGLFPSAEALAAQAIFVLLLVYALAATLRRRREVPEAAPEPRRAAGGR
jgi:high-affinity iron transporter